MQTPPSEKNPLRHPKPHFITGIVPKLGTVSADKSAPEVARPVFSVFPLYSVRQAPIQLEKDKDLEEFIHHIEKEPPISSQHSQPLVQFAECVIDPLSATGMHRSISIDFVTVTQGSVILEFENDTSQILETGVWNNQICMWKILIST